MPRDTFDWSSWGKSIRRERERREITRQRLAHRCHLAESTLRNIESGRNRPSLATVAEICVALGLVNPHGDILRLIIDGFPRRFARRVIFCALNEYREARRDPEAFMRAHYFHLSDAQSDDMRCDLDRVCRLLDALIPQVRTKKER